MTTPAPVSSRGPRFNPFSAEFRRDPYPALARLREEHPVSRTLGMWVLTRHADVHAVLADRSFSSRVIPQMVGKRGADPSGVVATGDRIARLGAASMVFTDDPEHARLRGLVTTVVTRSVVAELEPLVTRVARRLADRAIARGRLDAITDVATPLPVEVLCTWMALPVEIAQQVGRWTHEIRFLLEPGLMKAGVHQRVCTIVETFVSALEQVISDRRRIPGDDLITRLLAARSVRGDSLDEEEVAYVAIMFFVAGVETTRALIGNGLLAVLGRPQIAEELHRRPELLADAVREALRFDSPLQMTTRVATRDVDVGGHHIADGEHVLLSLGAANRDPEVFDDPDEFDPNRTGQRSGGHLAFGYGMHGCLGGALAELQAKAALTQFLHRDLRPVIDSDADIAWQDHSLIVRGMTHLPIVMRGAW